MAGVGSKPGERRGGRQIGTPNKATAEVKVVAQKHGARAIKELARIAFESDSDTARIAAIRELLDRGYGKARQPVDLGSDPDKPIVHRIERVIVRPALAGPSFEKVGTDIKCLE